MKKINIGVEVKLPEQECNDKKCPFHGNIKVRGRSFIGRVASTKAQKTATIEWDRSYYLPKFERYEKRRTRLHVHNPSCINAKENDIVRIMETRPISKTKTFVIIEKLGRKEIVRGIDLAEEEKKKEVKEKVKKKERPEEK